MKNSGTLIIGIIVFLFILNHPVIAQIDQDLLADIKATGRWDNKLIDYYGVKCAEIKLAHGESLNQVLRKIPFFENDFYRKRRRVSKINKLNLFYPSGIKASHGTDRNLALIPLEWDKEPAVFPDYDSSLKKERKYLLIDVGKGYLAMYEYGRLKAYYPISGGQHGTPRRTFRILGKEKEHFSRKYDMAWMPRSCHLFGDYFLHGGVIPGYADSHGCIRVMHFNGDNIDDSKIIFDWIEVGIPGRVI